jgi:hypothetical protein
MGSEAACTLHLDGRATRGTALLEQHHLVFRGTALSERGERRVEGPFRLAIPLKDIQSARAAGGWLAIRFGARAATFELGAPAARWADKISNPPSRADKLGVKAGLTVLLAGMSDASFRDELERRDVRIVTKAPAAGADIVFLGAERPAALNRLEPLRQAIKSNGAIWVVRPKGKPEVGESVVMAAGKQAGLVDVKVVSFSETHTAEKFVIPVAKRVPARTAPKRRTD